MRRAIWWIDMNTEQSDETCASENDGQSADSKPTSLLLLALIIFSPTFCLFGTVALASVSGFLLSDSVSSSILIGGLFLAGLTCCVAPIYCSYKLVRGLKPDGAFEALIGVLIWLAIVVANAFVTFATCAVLIRP